MINRVSVSLGLRPPDSGLAAEVEENTKRNQTAQVLSPLLLNQSVGEVFLDGNPRQSFVSRSSPGVSVLAGV